MAWHRDLRGRSQVRRLRRWRLTLVVVFGYGTAVHVLQVAISSGHPYPGTPCYLAAFFVSLTLVDPVVAVGLFLRRRWAVWSALAVLVLDAAANGYAVYVLTSGAGITVARAGQGVITLLAVAVALTAAALDRSFASSPRIPRSP